MSTSHAFFKPSPNSVGNLQFGGSQTGRTSTNCFGTNTGTKSFFGTSNSPAFGGFAAPFGTSAGPSFPSTSTSFGGNQSSTRTFATTGFAFSNQPKGSRKEAYTATKFTDDPQKPQSKLQSLSAMPVYSNKSHEELRLEDYNAGDRGQMHTSPSPSQAQSSVTASRSFSASGLYTSQTSSTQNSSNFFSPQTSSNLFSPQTSSNLFSPQTTNLFTSQNTSVFSPQTSSNIFSPQTSSNIFTSQNTSAFSPQTTSNLFSPQTSSSLFSSQTSSNLFSPQTTKLFTSQNTSAFCPQTSSNLFSPQTTNLFSSQNTSAFCPQTSSNLFSPQTTSNIFTSQNTSAFSPQTTSNLFSPQITSNFFSSQTTSAFSPQTSSSPFTYQTSPGLFSPQTTSTSCLPQASSGPFSNQKFPGFFSSQTTSSSVPQQTSSTFTGQTSFGPFSNKSSPSFFSPQTISNSVPQQSSSMFTSSSPFSNQNSPGIFSSQTTSNSVLAQTTSMFSPQTSFSPFSNKKPFSSEFHPQTSTNQTTPGLLSSQIPATTFGPKTSPTLLSQPTTNEAPVSVALPVLDNFRKCTHCPTFPAPELNITSSQGPALGSTVVSQSVVNANPFGELPAMTRLLINQPGSTISLRSGISGMPVVDKPSARIKLPSLLTSRSLSRNRMRLPARKYDLQSEGPKVPFFNKDEERPFMRENNPVPRENPRALLVLSTDLWPPRHETKEISPGMNASLRGNEHGLSSEKETDKGPDNVLKVNPSVNEPDPAKISKGHMDEIEELIPQLCHPEYYTEPSIKQLAEKEMAEPGFCSRVNDFEIGRYGYGDIKFPGETDLRRLRLDSLVEFENRSVVVYRNEKEKPPVGKGINKPAEVTLLNIHCIDKKTGGKYLDGPQVEKYKEMLIKKAENQGVEFISFDPAKGEWKFRVPHF